MTEKTTPILAPAPRTEPLVIPGRDPVPVTLLTGFLGAGKTTLLNRILNGEHGLRVGVLVNDFGAINIDAELVAGVEQNTISLTNGCVCCEIRDDLVNSLEQLLTRQEAVDYVILEASGVADSEGIVMTFLNPRYEGLLRLDSITCIIDAVGIFADGDNERLNLLKLRQIGFADLVVLNKTDLVGPEHIEVIREWIGHHIQRIRIVEATQCDVPLEILLAVGITDTTATTGCSRPGVTSPIVQCRSKRYAKWCRRSYRRRSTVVRGSSLLPTPLTNVLPSRWWGVAPKSLSWMSGESVRHIQRL
jgi:G3E family GTPase